MKHLFNDGWRFLLTPLGTTKEQAEAQKLEFKPVDVPHDWLIYDSENLYKDGIGWYQKTFVWEKNAGQKVFLCFEGIYMDSTVYVNGAKTGEWKYGYSGFTLDITEFLLQGENQILVSVCFQSPNSRWYSGAGIYRNVWLKETKKIYIEENGIYVSSQPQGDDFVLQVNTLVKGLSDTDEVQIVQRLFQKTTDGTLQEITMEQLELETGGNRVKYLVKNPQKWDVENPVLYTLQTELIKADIVLQNKTVLQKEENTIGFRKIKFDTEKGFFLNDRHLKLNGVCEHHDLGALGAAFYPAAMKRKFKKLKEMGVNAVRGTHNMMAPGFVELADEMGILLISEAFDMWERSKTEFDYARFFMKWSEADVESWVCRDRNHPSVIMWSIGNEIYDTHADAHGQEITVRLRELVRKFDPEGNAGVTIGSNYMPWENAQKCAELVEIQGYNYSEKYYEQHHKEHPDWVIYGSETSSIVQSRGVYHFPLHAGILADDDEQCSSLGNSPTSWGARSIEDCVTMDRDMEFSLGQFIWTGFDYIGEPTPYHTKNSYFGQLDTAGFPKDAYYVWQSAWTDYQKAPMVHVFPYWDFNEGQMIDVRVCSNGPQVELLLNGISQGKQTLSHAPGSGKQIFADYQVPYREGVITAIAYDEAGNEIARSEQHSFGNSASICIHADKKILQADGRDLIFVEISMMDKDGYAVENACDRVNVAVTGVGRLVGLDNGDSTDYDSYKGTSRRLFNGKLLAIIAAKLEPGDIQMTVSGKGLAQAQMTFSAKKAEDMDLTLPGLSALEENQNLPLVMGKADEIPVRKIILQAKEGRAFTQDKKTLTVEALIEPANAEDHELFFRVVNDSGVDSNLVTVKQEGNKAVMKALGDGSFRLRCMSKSGTNQIRLISQLEFTIQGLGPAYLNPYDFIAGSLYTSIIGEAGNGNERGVATGRGGDTCVIYENIDFGPLGSDVITVPIFALNDEAYPIQIWEGIPGKDDSELLADVIYQKPSIWNVYQEETWQLARRIKGITTLSFLVRQKIHIKGFSFRKYEKAWSVLQAASANHIIGDSFRVEEQTVREIGNNVSLQFEEMDFGERSANQLRIRGRAPKGNNTIHVRFFNGEQESKQIVEFAQCEEWMEREFTLTPMAGKWEITFVFLPGSYFDFDWFVFG